MVAYHRSPKGAMKRAMHPQARAVLDEISASLDTGESVSLEALRRQQLIEARFSGEPEAVKAVRDVQVDCPGGRIDVRLYFPDAHAPHPIVMFVHGGGWALGSVELSDTLCRALCRSSDMIIASAGYRLAPEHPFPDGLNDCYAALEWLYANATAFDADPALIAVCGDSAGGNLAASLALMARDLGGPALTLQVLIYPALDPTLSSPSFESSGTGFGLTRSDMQFFWGLYLQSAKDADDRYASPLQASSLKGVAPAFIVTAELDPLVDEGELYGERLRAAGVAARTVRYDGMIHGFMSYLGRVDAARAAVAECGDALKDAFRQRRK
jgi:acetyl esterase